MERSSVRYTIVRTMRYLGVFEIYLDDDRNRRVSIDDLGNLTYSYIVPGRNKTRQQINDPALLDKVLDLNEVLSVLREKMKERKQVLDDLVKDLESKARQFRFETAGKIT